MEFTKLLNFQEFKSLVFSVKPNHKAKLICDKIKDKCIIKNGILYILNLKTIVYEPQHKLRISLAKTVSSLIEISHDKLTEDEKNEISQIKKYEHVFQLTSIDKYIDLVEYDLSNDDINFDEYLDEIHFINGVYNLKTGHFDKRILNKHFVTNVISYEWEQSNEKDKAYIFDVLDKIYTDKKDLYSIIMFFGSVITGRTTEDQDIMFLLGQGSAGKSFIMELNNLALDCYFQSFQSSFFDIGLAESKKLLYSFIEKKYLLLCWVNEPNDKRFNDELFKNISDGKIETTGLYQNSQKTARIKSKLVITANNMPNIKMDSGIARRIKAYQHNSHFTDNIKDVDESKHIYLKNKQLLSSIKNNKMFIAWFNILAEYAKKWLNGEKITYSKNFDNMKKEIVDCNDIIQDFIDAKIELTKNEGIDRIGKMKMHEIFISMYKNSHITSQQLLSKMKDKGIQYKCDYRSEDGTKGCYIGVKLKTFEKLNEEINKSLNYGIDESKIPKPIEVDYKALYEKAQQEINDLKKRITELEKPKKTKGNVIIKKSKKEETKKNEIVNNEKNNETKTENETVDEYIDSDDVINLFLN